MWITSELRESSSSFVPTRFSSRFSRSPPSLPSSPPTLSLPFPSLPTATGAATSPSLLLDQLTKSTLPPLEPTLQSQQQLPSPPPLSSTPPTTLSPPLPQPTLHQQGWSTRATRRRCWDTRGICTLSPTRRRDRFIRLRCRR